MYRVKKLVRSILAFVLILITVIAAIPNTPHYRVYAAENEDIDAISEEEPDGGNEEEPDGGNEEEPDGGNEEEPDGGNEEEPDGGNEEEPDEGNEEEPDGGNEEEPDGGNGEEPDGGNGEEPDGGNEEEPDGGNEGEPDGGNEEEPDGGNEEEPDGENEEDSDDGDDENPDAGDDGEINRVSEDEPEGSNGDDTVTVDFAETEVSVAYVQDGTYDLESNNWTLSDGSSGSVNYAVLGNDDIVEFDEENDIVTFLKPGTVTIQASVTVDEESYFGTYTLIINKMIPEVSIRDLGGIDIKDTSVKTWIGNGSYETIVSTSNTEAAITYAITSRMDAAGAIVDDGIATIDSSSGVITLSDVGTIVVTVTVASDEFYNEVEVSYTLMIVKKDNPATFADVSTDISKWVGHDALVNEDGYGFGSYQNEVKNNESGANVTYSIYTEDVSITLDDYATIDENTGVVTLKQALATPILVKAEIEATANYNGKELNYNLIIVKNEQQELVFANSAPADMTYGDVFATNPNVVSGGNGKGVVTYSITSAKNANGESVDVNEVASIDEATGEVTIKTAGWIEVTATKEADEWYEEQSATYSLVINRAEQKQPIEISGIPAEIVTYGDNNNYYSLEVAGGNGNGEISYDIIDGPATIEGNQLTVTAAGIVYLNVTKAADECYKEVTITKSFEIAHAEQIGFRFAENMPESVTYNQYVDNTYELESVGGCGAGQVTYTIVEESDVNVATITVDNKIKFLKAGKVVVEASKAGDACYNAATPVRQTIIVEKASQSIEFLNKSDEMTPIEIVYGTIEYINEASEIVNVLAGDGIGYGSGDIIYQITKGSDIATVDENGKIQFMSQKTGEIEVTATKESDSCYNGAQATYVINLSYLSIPIKSYTITGEQKNSESGWYTGNVTVTPIKGYQISYTNNFEGPWEDKIVLTGDGIHENIEVYLKDANGYITDKISLEPIKIDTQKPTDMNITYNQSLLEKIMEVITFNYYQSEVDVTLTAIDSNSGVSSFTYCYTDEIGQEIADTVQTDVAENDSYTFSIAPEFRGRIAFTVQDTAGNSTDTLTDTSVIVADSIAPVAVVDYSKANQVVRENDITKRYYEENARVDIKIIEANFEANEVEVKLNGVPIACDWMTTGMANEWVTTFNWSTEGEYQLEANYTDYSNNIMETCYSDVVIIDTTLPELDITYDAVAYRKDEASGKEYFGQDVTATIAIKEKYFRIGKDAENSYDLDAILTAVDVEGNVITPIIKDAEGNMIENYVTYLQDNSNWVLKEGTTDTYTVELTFASDATYQLDMQYKDVATNCVAIEKLFVVDKVAPEISVSYNTDTALNGNYYNADRTATITITDQNIVVDDIDVTVITKDITDSTVSFDLADKISLWTQGVAGSKDVWTATIAYDVDANYEFVINCTDMSGNEAEEQTDEFTVDKVAPDSDLFTIEYSESVLEKFIETISYKFFKANVVVTMSAEDMTSGIMQFDWSYQQEAGSSASYVKVTGGTIRRGDADFTLSQDGKTATASFVLTASEAEQYRGNISFKATDMSGNDSSQKVDTSIVVVDNVSPTIEVEYTTPKQEVGNDYYYDAAMELIVKITEANFYGEDVQFTVTNIDNPEEPIAVTKTITDWVEDTEKADTWIGVLNLEQEGDYRVTIEYSDRSNNKMTIYNSKHITIDKENPIINVSYAFMDSANDGNTSQVIEGRTFYNNNVSATISITEHNFRIGQDNNGEYDLNVMVVAMDSAGNTVTVPEYQDIMRNAVWTQNGDVYTTSVNFITDANYTFSISYEDMAGRVVTSREDKFTVDKAAPVVLVEYSDAVNEQSGVFKKLLSAITFGLFYQDIMTVTLTAEDETAGIYEGEYWFTTEDEETTKIFLTADDMVFTGKGATKTITIDPQFRGKVNFIAKDIAGNSTASNETTVVVVDNVSPKIQVAYAGELKQKVDMSNAVVEDSAADANTRYIYNGEITATATITESNFWSDDVQIIVERDGKAVTVGDGYSYSWEADNDEHTLTVMMGKKTTDYVDGDYQLKISYTDRSTNKMTNYVSRVMTVDTTKPAIEVIYDNNDEHETNVSYYKANRIAELKVLDRNIIPSDIIISVSGSDVSGSDVEFELTDKMTQWTKGVGDEQYTWTSTIVYDVDANYEFTIECEDLATNNSEKEEIFVVDKAAPVNGTIQYSDDVSDFEDENGENDSDTDTVLQRFVRIVSYLFYKDEVTVTLTVEDVTSGVDTITWSYAREEDSSVSNVASRTETIGKDMIIFSEDGTTATVEFKLTSEEAKQYRGHISFFATDMSGNVSESWLDDGTIVVVDNISPTRVVTYSPAKAVINSKDMSNLSGFTWTSEDEGVNLYYDAAATLTFEITEVNFYPEDVVIKLDNGTTVEDVTPTISKWKQNGDKWTTSITTPIKDDKAVDGDYVVTMDYKDRSLNEMKSYKSGIITIDTVNPTINVSHSQTELVAEIDARKYHNATQSATITIVEHNFRAQDVVVKVSGKDAAESDVDLQDYASAVKVDSNWKHNGDTHTIVLTFEKDANYTFGMSYADLVGRAANQLEEYLFTVDTTDPTDIEVEYSTSLIDIVMQSITFGFYNAPATVTMKAADATTGIYKFNYSYLKAEGVSNVNAESVNMEISTSNISYSTGKQFATATFKVPASDLSANNQYNGTIEFTATDIVDRSVKLVGDRRIVVDNIAPQAIIEYNDPVRTENNVQYYDTGINATISVTEANFNFEDVVVTVAKDNGSAAAISVNWHDNTVDSHVGTFSLEDDGDYVIHVSYKDRANNEMQEYISNKMVIDTQVPTITVEGVRNQSASNDEVIGFVLTVEDENFAFDSFKPKFSAEIMDEHGDFRIVDMAAKGTISTEVSGRRYKYTVTNLDLDGIYSLTCSVNDMSDNMSEEMYIVDSAVTDNLLRFSVNRNGSTYSLSERTRAMVGAFVKEAGDVVITEINATELSDIKVTVFKNDKTIALEEGKDYRIDISGGSGSWYVYTYNIKSNNFVDDGIYRITLHSEDEAGNIIENTLDVTDVNITFGVDKTVPNLIVTNLESNVTYPVEELTVVMQANDNLKLETVEVALDGKKLRTWNSEEITEMSTQMLDYEFTVPGDSTDAHNVNVTLTDAAGNVTIQEITNFYVTTNAWIRYVNNRPLFFGTVGGGAITVNAIVLLIRRLRRKFL